jgi:hypothetical protein
MKHPIRPFLLAALTCASLVTLPAHALTLKSPDCGASTVTNLQPGYVSCLGSFEGNIDNQLAGGAGVFAAINTNFGLNTNTYFSSENFAVTGNPFSQNEGGLDDGVINFDQNLTGSFVLGLKQGNGFSLYLFNASTVAGGIGSIIYDTNGVKTNSGNDLSHAGFFGTPNIAPVPEPETYGMLLAGLGLIGVVARRRKAKQA